MEHNALTLKFHFDRLCNTRKHLATKLNFGTGTTSNDEILYGRTLAGVFTVEDFCFYVFESNGSTPNFYILKSKYEICFYEIC